MYINLTFLSRQKIGPKKQRMQMVIFAFTLKKLRDK